MDVFLVRKERRHLQTRLEQRVNSYQSSALFQNVEAEVVEIVRLMINQRNLGSVRWKLFVYIQLSQLEMSDLETMQICGAFFVQIDQ